MKSSVQNRLEKLEKEQRFIQWFLAQRFNGSLTLDELCVMADGGKIPDPVPNRPSELDGLDRDTLLKRWEQDERLLGGRTVAELKCYVKSGLWPEQKAKFHYSMKDGNLIAEWQIASETPGLEDTLENDG
jgi:hypothetical protein